MQAYHNFLISPTPLWKPFPTGGPDLSFSRWRRCYKSRRSFPVYLASEVQKRSNAPVMGQTLATKASKSRAIPPYVPGVTPAPPPSPIFVICICYGIVGTSVNNISLHQKPTGVNKTNLPRCERFQPSRPCNDFYDVKSISLLKMRSGELIL